MLGLRRAGVQVSRFSLLISPLRPIPSTLLFGNRTYCVAKFGLGPRFEKYVPELKGEPLELGDDTDAEFQEKLNIINPDRDLMDEDKMLATYKENLAVIPQTGKVVKLVDEELRSYTAEEYFGISNEHLTALCDVVSGRSDENPPDIRTTRRLDRDSFIHLLTLQGRKIKPDQAFRTLSIMEDLRMEIDEQVYTLVISSCKKEEDIPRARELFDNMLMEGIPLTVTCCTAMMNCYTKNLQLEEAYTLMRTYALGPERIIEPDNAIFTTLIHGCMRKENYQLAWDTFDMMRQFYLEGDTIVFNLMIDICARTYEAEKAFNFFDEMKFLKLPIIDHTYNAMLKVCSRRHDYFHKGFELLKEMKIAGYTPTTYTYHMLLSSCGPVGNLKAADLIMNQMEADSVPITVRTYSILLNVMSRTIQTHPIASKKLALVERADMVFKQLQKYVLDKNSSGKLIVPEDDTITVQTLNCYISVYANAMFLRQAEALLPLYEEFGLKPDGVTYTTLLKMFSKARRVENCFDIYRQMKQLDIPINKFAWTHLLNVCARAKYFNNGFKILRLMIASDFEIMPSQIHLFYRALASNKVPELNELKELVWPYPKCRVFFLRPPPAYPQHPEPHSHVRPGEVKRKLKGKRWKKKSSNRKNKPKAK